MLKLAPSFNLREETFVIFLKRIDESVLTPFNYCRNNS